MKVMSLNCGILKRNRCDPRIFVSFLYVCVCAFQSVIPPDKLFGKARGISLVLIGSRQVR